MKNSNIKSMITRYVYLKLENDKKESKLLQSAMKRLADEYKNEIGFDIEDSKAFIEGYKNKK